MNEREYNRQDSFPHNHREVRTNLQTFLRAMAILGAVFGAFVGLFYAAHVDNGAPSTATSTVIFIATYGGILAGCLWLWVAAAIIDALRVIAIATIRSMP